MISTVTFSTLSLTITSVLGSIALIVVLILFILLLEKDLVISSSSGRMERLSKALNIGIIPLFIAFLIIAVIKVSEVLR